MLRAASLIVAWSTCSFALGQGNDKVAPDAGVVDLRCLFPPGAAVEIALKMDLKGSIDVKLADSTVPFPFVAARAERLLDESVSFDAEKNETVLTRTWLDARETSNGDVRDPAYAGVVGTFAFDGKNVRLTIGDRRLPKSDLESMLRLYSFVGAQLELPEAVVAGHRIAFDFADAVALMQAVFGNSKVPVIHEAWWILDRFDAASNAALLSGRVAFVDENLADDDELKLKGQFTIDLTAEVDVKEHRLTKMTLAGTIDVSGAMPRAGTMSGRLTLKGSMASKPVADAAALRKAPPKFRTNTWSYKAQGFSVDLPAYWAKLPEKDKKFVAQFMDTRNTEEIVYRVSEFGGDGTDPTDDAYIAQFTTGLVKSGFEDTKFKKSKTALGKAITYTAGLPGDRRVFGVLTSARPAQKLAIQWVGPAALLKTGEQDLQKVIQSLKALK